MGGEYASYNRILGINLKNRVLNDLLSVIYLLMVVVVVVELHTFASAVCGIVVRQSVAKMFIYYIQNIFLLVKLPLVCPA